MPNDDLKELKKPKGMIRYAADYWKNKLKSALKGRGKNKGTAKQAISNREKLRRIQTFEKLKRRNNREK